MSATCALQGCTQSVFPNSPWCSKSHRDEAPKCQLVNCNQPAFPGSQYCTKKHRDAATSGQGGGVQLPAPNATVLPQPVAAVANVLPNAPAPGTTPPATPHLRLPAAPATLAAPVIPAGLCQLPGCTLPVHPGSQYCSRRHRNASGSAPGSPWPRRTCQYPGCSKPPFPGGQYCSRSHRDNAPAPSRANPGFTSQPSGPSSSNGSCAYTGCSKPVFPGGRFCSIKHRDALAPQLKTTLATFVAKHKASNGGSDQSESDESDEIGP